MLFSYTLPPWKTGKILSNLKSECCTGWDGSQNIYKCGRKRLLQFRKHFFLPVPHQGVLQDWKQWGGVSLLSVTYSDIHQLRAEVRGKEGHSLGQRQVALCLNHLTTSFSLPGWLPNQSYLESSWQSLMGNQSRLWKFRSSILRIFKNIKKSTELVAKILSSKEDRCSVAAQSCASSFLGQQKWKAFSLEKAYPEIQPSAARQTQFQRTVMTDVSENACQLAKQGSLKKSFQSWNLILSLRK